MEPADHFPFCGPSNMVAAIIWVCTLCQAGRGVLDRHHESLCRSSAVPKPPQQSQHDLHSHVPLQCAVAAGTDSKAKNSPQALKCPSCMPQFESIWETPRNNYYFQKIRSPDCGKLCFVGKAVFFNVEEPSLSC